MRWAEDMREIRQRTRGSPEGLLGERPCPPPCPPHDLSTEGYFSPCVYSMIKSRPQVRMVHLHPARLCFFTLITRESASSPSENVTRPVQVEEGVNTARAAVRDASRRLQHHGTTAILATPHTPGPPQHNGRRGQGFLLEDTQGTVAPCTKTIISKETFLATYPKYTAERNTQSE